MSQALFTYGTLTFPEVLEALLGHAVEGRPARLPHHRSAQVLGADFPGVCPAHGVGVAGVLWEGLTSRDLARLDAYESDLYLRERHAVIVEAGAAADSAAAAAAAAAAATVGVAPGPAVQAWAYVLAPGRCGRLGHTPWDRERFARRGLSELVAALRIAPPGGGAGGDRGGLTGL